jgi:hypothetical protein
MPASLRRAGDAPLLLRAGAQWGGWPGEGYAPGDGRAGRAGADGRAPAPGARSPPRPTIWDGAAQLLCRPAPPLEPFFAAPPRPAAPGGSAGAPWPEAGPRGARQAGGAGQVAAARLGVSGQVSAAGRARGPGGCGSHARGARAVDRGALAERGPQPLY